MQKITISGRMGKYINHTADKKLSNGTTKSQTIFTLYARGTRKDEEGNYIDTAYRCMYFGMSEKMKENLMTPKGKNDNGTIEYYSRHLIVMGDLSISMTEQELPVVGCKDEYETVLAPNITIIVNSIEFLDGNPAKKKDKEGVEGTDINSKGETREQRKARIALERAKNAKADAMQEPIEDSTEERELKDKSRVVVSEDDEDVTNEILAGMKKPFVVESAK